jgi:hypothetical protein
MVDLKKKIFEAKDIKEELVDVPEWGCKVLLRGLSGEQRATVLSGVMPNPQVQRMDYKKLYGETLVFGLCDPETKQPIFQPTDIPIIMSKSGGIVERLATMVMELSGMSGNALDAATKN